VHHRLRGSFILLAGLLGAPGLARAAPTLTAAWLGENVVRPGVLVGVDGVVLDGVHQVVLSGQLGLTRFAPFSVTQNARGRVLYRIALPEGFRVRALGVTVGLYHTLPTAPVYEPGPDGAVRAGDAGWVRPRLTGTTGVGYDLEPLTDLPLTVFLDAGMSLEPYHGVLRFHLEHALGVGWTF
jgi:hypothetical protein